MPIFTQFLVRTRIYLSSLHRVRVLLGSLHAFLAMAACLSTPLTLDKKKLAKEEEEIWKCRKKRLTPKIVNVYPVTGRTYCKDWFF